MLNSENFIAKLTEEPSNVSNHHIFTGQKLNIPTGKSVPIHQPKQSPTTPTLGTNQTPVTQKPQTTQTTPAQTADTPTVQTPTTSTNGIGAAKINIDEFLSPEKGSNAIAAIVIGNAEGNRTTDGGFVKPNYYGHKDPGDGLWNIGSFSRSNDRFKNEPKARTPEEADRLHLQHMQKAKGEYVEAMKKAGLDPNNALLASTFLDASNQSERASKKMLAPENLAYIKEKGVSVETMKDWRLGGFVNLKTGQRWLNGKGDPVGGGLANVAHKRMMKKEGRRATEQEIQQTIRQDQGRRIDAMVKALKNLKLLSVGNQTVSTQTPVSEKPAQQRPAVPTSNGRAVNDGEVSRSQIKIPYAQLKAGNDIRLSPQVIDRMINIAADYHQATGKTLIITDGNRTSVEQGFMMIRQIRKGKIGIYRDKQSASEIKSTYDAGVAVGKSDRQIAEDIGAVIKNQIKNGHYISPHLRNNAADVRFSDMSPNERAKFVQIVNKYGGEVVKEDDHFHLQWR